MLEHDHTPESWIPLVDYAAKTGVSLSTLRRHIKANKIPYRVVNGRYLLCDPDRTALPVSRMERELLEAREEIAELKMLIALYEEKLSPSKRSN